MEYQISIVLDKRYIKYWDKFPVKIRVYSVLQKKAKLYVTGKDFTEKEFQSIWETTKPRKEHQPEREFLKHLEDQAVEAAKNIKPFSFEQFEKKIFRKVGDETNVFYHYKQAIDTLKKNKQIGTANTYELSEKSIKDYILYDKGRIPEQLSFFDITPKFLQGYENFMLGDLEGKKARSRTTVSMYLRVLRTLFNTAIAQKEIDSEFYPFGKRKYQIPASKNIKKAFSKEQLQILFRSEAKTPEQQKAKDFWFFSYGCNGMNIKDIALLKYEDIQDDKIIFYRAKTINTAKTNLKPVKVYLSEFAKTIIVKYGNRNKGKKDNIFSITDPAATENQNHFKIKNFTKFINQHIKKLAEANGLPGDISTYWARHSFATNAIRSGASMEFVSEALSHSDLKTTQNYFAGFDESSQKEFIENMMNL